MGRSCSEVVLVKNNHKYRYNDSPSQTWLMLTARELRRLGASDPLMLIEQILLRVCYKEAMLPEQAAATIARMRAARHARMSVAHSQVASQSSTSVPPQQLDHAQIPEAASPSPYQRKVSS